MRSTLAIRWAERLSVSALAVAAIASAHAAPASPTVDRPAMMRLVADSWLQTQAADGSLPYGFDFLADRPTGVEGKPWAFIVRQVGSFYMLSEYYRYSGDNRLREPIQRALAAFDQHSLPIGKGRVQRLIEATRILSLPVARWKLTATLDRFGLLYERSGPGKVVSPDGRYESALVGAVAVALLTELMYSRVSGDQQFAGLRSAWLAGLLSLHIPGGGFRETPTSIDDSDFNNGEAWLALAVYCDMYPEDTKTAGILLEVDDAMMERYSAKPTVNFYHWGAVVAAQRFRTTGDPRFLRFLKNQAEIFFDRFEQRLDPESNNCAEMEGLAATLATLNRRGEADAVLAERIRVRLMAEAAKLPRLQIQPGQTTLAVGGEAVLTAPRLAEFGGAFLTGQYQPSTRVDAAAHCLMAMVMIERDGLLPTSK